ncbi:hypothetical protein LTR50_003965 [Elasticomyces elasticus]|nr:hypothetical protein LTR50_003965 [Elasticomyces elasticus]
MASDFQQADQNTMNRSTGSSPQVQDIPGKYAARITQSPAIVPTLQRDGSGNVTTSTNSTELLPSSTFLGYSIPVQKSPQNDPQAFDISFGRSPVISPNLHSGPPSYSRQTSIQNVQDEPGSTTSARTRDLSIGSLRASGQQIGSGSPDGSDPISPNSVRGRGSVGLGDNAVDVALVNSGIDSANPQNQDHVPVKTEEEKVEQPPPWSELKTKAGKERKRLPLACIACRRKKIRCSGEKPACKHCMRSRIPCVYKVTTRKAAPRTDYMAMLDKRLKRMEERVIRIIPKEDQSNLAAMGRAIVKPALTGPSPSLAGVKKRTAKQAFGDGLEEWATTRADNVPATSVVATALAQPSKGADVEKNKLSLEGAEHLPSPEIQQHLSEVFFDFVYGQAYHLLHKPSFMRKLAAGTVPPVLLLAVCAISARFSTHPRVRTEPAFLRGESWASAAREIALRRYDSPNITILIVYLILGLHEFGTCQGGRSWMFGGMAQRMAYALQLHKDLDHDPLGRDRDEKCELTFTDREIRRRTMWACFIMDRFNSSGTDRPMLVDEQYIQAQLPIKEHYFQMEITGPTEDLNGAVPHTVEPDAGQISDAKDNMGVAAYLVRLVAIWGRVVKYHNLGGKERDEYPMWTDRSVFHELKTAIECFKASLPASLRYTPDNLRNHSGEKTANQFLFLHIAYNQVILFMNRFALPSMPGLRQPLPRESPQQFVQDAGRAALEAANQISVLINEAMDHLVVAPFAGYCAFFSSTVHIHGVFSKNPALEVSSKQNLAWNVKYLSKMKRYWENLKDLYRRHADAALRGYSSSTSNAATTPNPKTGKKDAIFQYGDWFDHYPHGVRGTDYEEPVVEITKEAGSDAVLGQKSDMQSVEEFFAKSSPPRKAQQQRKVTKKRHSTSASNAKTANAIDSTPHPNEGQSPASGQQQSHSRRQVQKPFDQTFAPQITFDAAQSQAFTQTYQPDLPMLNLRATYPGIPSQPDRHTAYPTYAPMNPSASVGGLHGPSDPNNLGSGMDPMSVGNVDMTDFGAFNGLESDNIWDPSSAWFMPFNMDPPNIGDEDGFLGGYDFPEMKGFGDGGAAAMGLGMDDGLVDNQGQDGVTRNLR